MRRYSILCAVAAAVAALIGAAPSPTAPLPGQIVVDPTNRSWLFYQGGGPHFMAGPGDPEGFLYRGSRNADGTRNGDQMTLINKMKGTGANCIYFQAIRSHGGDGPSNHNPFNNPGDSDSGINMKILDQWETWFDEMDKNGIVIYLFFYDDAIKISTGPLGWPMSGGNLDPSEKNYIETIVNRFEHHKHLVWCVMEEVQEMGSDYVAHAKKIAETIRNADNNNHAIAVHKLSGVSFNEFADDPNIDVFAIQYNQGSAANLHSGMVTAWNNANGRYNLNMSESANYGSGKTARLKDWACAMGGAYVMRFETDIASTSVNDLRDCGRLVQFMESTNFHEMSPNDSLANGGTQYVLALPGDSYIAYASALSGNIGLKSMTAGTYDFKWFDCTDGTTVNQTGVSVGSGNQTWGKPGGIGNELAVYIKKTGSSSSNVPPTANPQNVTVQHNTAKSITLTYSDPDGPGPYSFAITQQPSNGTLSGSGANRTYTPNSGYSGSDSFRFTVNDGKDSSSPATVSITVQSATNQPPVASNQSETTPQDTAVTTSLLYNDPDGGPGPYTVTITQQPSNGTLSGVGNDRTYTPNSGFAGTDSYQWRVNDGADNSNIATVTITVTSTGSAPAAPSNLNGTAASSSRIDLSWQDNSSNETAFVIERATGVGALTVTLQNYAGTDITPTIEQAGTADSFQVGALVVNDRSDTWTAVPAALSGATRLLTARDDRNQSPVGSMYTVTVSGPCTIFLPLDPRYSGGQTSWMDASWTDSGMSCDSSAAGQTGWKIWQKSIAAAGNVDLGVDTATYDGVCYVFVGGGNWSAIGTVNANVTSFADTGLNPATTYAYRVRATNGNGDSPYSNVATATTPSAGPDADGDGLPDAWENTHFGNTSTYGAGDDPDGDGLTNLQEYNAGTNPTLSDSDADGLTDAQEVFTYGTNPNVADSDNDGMVDGDEAAYSLDPLNGDQDNNTIPDGLDDWNGNGDDNQTDIGNGISPGSPPGGSGSGGGNGSGGSCGLTGIEALLLLVLLRRKR